MRTCKIKHEGMVMDGEDEVLISNDELIKLNFSRCQTVMYSGQDMSRIER